MKIKEAAPPGVELPPGEAPNQSPINDVIAFILRTGVYISATVLVIGLVAFLAQPDASHSSVTEVLRSSAVRPDVPASFQAVADGLRHGSASAIIELGVLVLLATPVFRVAASIFLFLFERDWLYTTLTAFVLALLLISIFLLGALGIG